MIFLTTGSVRRLVLKDPCICPILQQCMLSTPFHDRVLPRHPPRCRRPPPSDSRDAVPLDGVVRLQRREVTHKIEIFHNHVLVFSGVIRCICTPFVHKRSLPLFLGHAPLTLIGMKDHPDTNENTPLVPIYSQHRGIVSVHSRRLTRVSSRRHLLMLMVPVPYVLSDCRAPSSTQHVLN